MAWTLEFEAAARRQLRKLPRAAGERILAGLESVALSAKPRERGKAMTGTHAGYWRYRFGDYRVIARIEDRRMVIVVIAVGNRREVYR
ncbi:MAG TPA: type II toxin-antitoxin system RelE/ParE family toxin [Croceibacterium sp.]|nr:type II toxin-antitoxin system RelE/ParE family toxin [Croceibacterium sp.]